MSYRILEVGPESTPLGETIVGNFKWLPFPESDYTAVQPPVEYAADAFPEAIKTLPNVTYIEKPIQDAGLADESFDEVYACNVLSDPSIRHQLGEIVLHMGRVLRSGGLFTVIDTYTPEYGLRAIDLIDFFENDHLGTYEIKSDLELHPLDGISYVDAPPDWLDTAGKYMAVIPARVDRAARAHTGIFTQLVKR